MPIKGQASEQLAALVVVGLLLLTALGNAQL